LPREGVFKRPFFLPKFDTPMAKQQRYLRKVGKNGKPYYFELKKDTKGITRYVRISDDKGAKKFVQKNFSKLTSTSKKSLSEKEQKTLNRSRGQRKTTTYDGVRIPKKVIKFLQKEQVIPQKLPKDLKNLNIPNIKRGSDFVNIYERLANQANLIEVESAWGLKNFRMRTKNSNLYKLSQEIKPWTDLGYALVVGADGTEYSGNDAYERLRQYEISEIQNFQEQNSLIAFITFNYNVQIQPQTREVLINLRDNPPPVPMYSEPMNVNTSD
jgi:hypothetical protein